LRNCDVAIQSTRPAEKQAMPCNPISDGCQSKSRIGPHLAGERFTPALWAQSSRLASIWRRGPRQYSRTGGRRYGAAVCRHQIGSHRQKKLCGGKQRRLEGNYPSRSGRKRMSALQSRTIPHLAAWKPPIQPVRRPTLHFTGRLQGLRPWNRAQSDAAKSSPA
jgi:hypothetical protein